MIEEIKKEYKADFVEQGNPLNGYDIYRVTYRNEEGTAIYVKVRDSIITEMTFDEVMDMIKNGYEFRKEQR